MSLEKEAEKYYKELVRKYQVGYSEKYNLTIHDMSDFATQQTEKISTELEQTKEKLKRCEGVIDLLERFVCKVGDRLDSDNSNGDLSIEADELNILLTELKDKDYE